MSAIEPFCKIIGINPIRLSRKENLFLEGELFIHIYEGLKEIYKTQVNYIKTLNLNLVMEKNMLEGNFIRCLINDILLSGEYTLEGIAHYTNTPEDIIYDIVSGNNLLPSLVLSRKIIEIHRSLRPSLYKDILNKLLA